MKPHVGRALFLSSTPALTVVSFVKRVNGPTFFQTGTAPTTQVEVFKPPEGARAAAPIVGHIAMGDRT